jgi:hypothetical protein
MDNICFGTYQWKLRYYDVVNGRVSQYFYTPIQSSDKLIAYFSSIGDERVLIVQDIFDKSTYYKEIRRDFSILCYLGTSPAEFINNNTQLVISYWANPDDEIVTETIDL